MKMACLGRQLSLSAFTDWRNNLYVLVMHLS